MEDQTRRSRGEVHMRLSVVKDGWGMVMGEVEEEEEEDVVMAIRNISFRHLIIGTVSRRLNVREYLGSFISEPYRTNTFLSSCLWKE